MDDSSEMNADPRPVKAAPVGDSEPTKARPAPRRAFLWTYLGYAAALVLFFHRALLALFSHALNSELHSHILLIPFITGYLLHIRKKELPVEFSPSPGWALLPFAAGVIAWVAERHWPADYPPLSHSDGLSFLALSFVCFLMAGGFCFLGRKWMGAAAFPAAFLLFMVPLPDRVVDALETASTLASAEAADWFFGFAGVPVLRDGVIFQLPSIVIKVAQECSGIRSSLVLFITALIAAQLFLRSPWRRAILVAFVIPLGIVRNGFRILVIGWLCVEVGPQMIHSAIHTRGGPVFFALSLIPLFLLLWWLRKGESRTPTSGTRKDSRSDH